ncbi:MAG: flagellar biosynthetic protein FliR [Lachnospiraceae bacterium]|nr:flagellar biosynthetic protein FliR [Lachnospiraceae bacterium]
MNITIENIECYLLIIVRISAFIFSAPVFSTHGIPMKVKVFLSVFVSLIVYNTIEVTLPPYGGVISFAILVLQESIVGLILGFITNACLYIVNYSGRMIDMEIGLSMANMMDPATKLQTSITGALYTQVVSLLLIVSNMHYYLIRAIVDTFNFVPIGETIFHRGLFEIMQSFMFDFFVVGFRIILPIFGMMLITNVVLGVLARIAPQMNMFVVGMQLKVFAGLVVLVLIASTLPMVADYIFDLMKEYLSLFVKALAP